MAAGGFPLVELKAPGVLVVRYGAAAELAPEMQTAVMDTIRNQASSGAVGILFALADGVRMVPASVPMFWLGATSDEQHHLTAIAVVSSSIAVRAAASAFGVTNVLRGNRLSVRSESSFDVALAWVKTSVAQARAGATG